MDLIVAVYDDWGIGKDGTQPITLSADRKFFREATRDAMVIVGRKTLADFPGGKPLPKRVNVLLTRGNPDRTDVIVCHSPEEALKVAQSAPKVMVIGGGSVYRQMLPYCDVAHVTKIDHAYEADAYFPDLDSDPEWEITADSDEQVYFDITYQFLKYERKKS